MPALPEARLRARFQLFSRACAAAVIVVGCAVLLGWWLDVESLKTVLPGMVAMNPGGTAPAFVLAGASLWLQQGGPARGWRRRAGLACAAGVTLIALLRVVAYWLGHDFG